MRVKVDTLSLSVALACSLPGEAHLDGRLPNGSAERRALNQLQEEQRVRVTGRAARPSVPRVAPQEPQRSHSQGRGAHMTKRAYSGRLQYCR